MSPSRPFLSIGSHGEPVRLMQKAMNLATSRFARLTEDAAFGPLTRGRVTEFQGQNKLATDGQVGPQTWGALETWITILQQMINGASNADEQSARAKVVEVAEKALGLYGWPAGLAKKNGRPDPDVMRSNPLRIIAARCADPTNPIRPRQGAMSLALIYSGAGGTASGKVAQCATISSSIEELYNPVNGESTISDAEKRRRLNNEDIGSWCGIFTMFVSRLAGMKYGGWPYKVDGAYNVETGRRAFPRDQCDVEKFGTDGDVRPGDIGIFDYMGTNHHFLVVGVDGQDVISIDGNVGDPDVNTRFPWSSVVASRRYRRSGKTSLMPVGGPGGVSDKCYFMRPIWENLSKR